MDFTFETLDDQADPTFNQLLSINDNGVIAGYFGSGAPGHPNKGYTLDQPYGQGNYSNENFPGSAQTQVTGINDDKTTVGFFVDGNGDNFGFIEKDGQFKKEVDPNAVTAAQGGPIFEQFLGINEKGEVAGFYNDAGGNSHGFVYDEKTNQYSAVNIAGATSVTATDVNDNGVVSGFFTQQGKTEGFLDTNGHVDVLTGPKGASDVQALGLNDKGQVVGSFVGADGNTHGFLYSSADHQYTQIDDSHAVGSTIVNGINNNGAMVGFYVDAAGNTDGMLVKPNHS